MSTFETECFFCRGPITSVEAGEDEIVILAVDGEGNITRLAHREPCYENEQKWQAAEDRADAKRESFSDWEGR